MSEYWIHNFASMGDTEFQELLKQYSERDGWELVSVMEDPRSTYMTPRYKCVFRKETPPTPQAVKEQEYADRLALAVNDLLNDNDDMRSRPFLPARLRAPLVRAANEFNEIRKGRAPA